MTKDRSLGIVGIKMPVKYVAEMFADRVAACKTYEKDRYTTMSPWRYYKRTKEYITIHPETRKLLERLLKMLAVKGEDEVYRYLRYLIRSKKNILRNTIKKQIRVILLTYHNYKEVNRMAKNKTSYNNKTSDCSNSTNSTNSTNCRNSASDKAGHAAKSAYKNTADSMKNSEDSEDEYSQKNTYKNAYKNSRER